MKRVVFALLLLPLAIGKADAQESKEVYQFLRLPVSAHAAALGGDNISITDDDPTLIFHNPALISNVSDRSINLNLMTYMEGAKTASASFVKAAGERGTWGATAQYMDYGTIKQTTADNIQLGTASAKDIALSGTYAYLLSNRIAGGITARFISSSIAGYNSLAVAFDLGINYYNEEHEWSVSAVAKNLGGQVKAYDEDFERIPLDLQVGATKRLQGAPLRFSATLSRLNRWDVGFIKHLSVGADLLLGEHVYIAGGYSFRRASEMKIASTDGESSHGAGLSLGAGLQLERFKLNIGYGKYHVSASSLLINLTYVL
ncbi:MAG: type IX secretion system protein PorQ [Prevotella sp.]|nr:type IX secretion system protein PorQ [Prevotella sp.]